MPSKPLNRSLHAAKATKQDEFYTQLSDIEKELRHYTKHFKNKTVLCNCDDPKVSNFFHYFSYNFEKLKLKKLITTCYKNCDAELFSKHTAEKGIYLEYNGDKDDNRVPDPDEIGIHKLKGDGDFRSEECVKLLKQADIVVTNPPFSLFRQYVEQLVKYKKKFLIIGTTNGITYKEIFSLIKRNKIWLGFGFDNGNAFFGTPYGDKYAPGVYDPKTNLVKFRNVTWFTNLEHQKRHEELILFNDYSQERYPTYDNYDAIEVSRTKDIPTGYDGAMGVPITFLERYNPDQFEILGITDRDNNSGLKAKTYTDEDAPNPGDLNRRAAIKIGKTYKPTYARLLIRKKEMKIELEEIAVQKLTDGFADNAEQGVVAYGGKLDIRPPYQREFIYKDKQRDAVIDSVRKDFPLNVMYWAVRNDGHYEVIDGQQRTLSICQYVNGDFSMDIDGHQLAFHNLQNNQQQQILDYKLMVYFCSGTDSEKLDWFRTINIAGEEHTPQELRNAVYAGPWTADAKRYFSKTSCPAYGLASDYLRGSPIRQEYLETAIYWQSEGKIEDYMSTHQHDKNATPLWQYFQKVIGWVKDTFPEYREEMRYVQWGPLYNQFRGKTLSAKKLEKEIAILMEDEDVTKKSGIYPYVLDRDESHLNIRAFSDKMKREAYERQKKVCPKCKEKFDLDKMEADHFKPWHEGGKTNAANCQMLCKEDNRRKSGR